MTPRLSKRARRHRAAAFLLPVLALSAVAASAQFLPNNLVVSRSVYDNNPSNVKIGTPLPPNCTLTTAACPSGTGAPYDGTYPTVFNNALYDGSFGVTSKIFLDQISLFGQRFSSLQVPNSDQHLPSSFPGLVTSFPSKSELALNLSPDGKYLTFMGYLAPTNALDISNSNTPLAVDPTNPDGQTPTYRAVAKVGRDGVFQFFPTNAYSGNNGRAAIFNSAADLFYTAGNAGNGANPQPNAVILGAGAQLVAPLTTPGLPTPVASFSITALGDKADKVGKDDNFRGLTVFNNVLYYTKGSGGNGVNTVYFVDTTGKACPNGVGLPVAGAPLPSAPLPYAANTLQTSGLPTNMCILAGFPTGLAKNPPVSYPFGLWFANKTTLYVADEGDQYQGGADLYTHAAAQTTAGLQKWTFNAATNQWQLAYVLKNGLGIGTPYTVAGYPTGNNPATKLPWAPATDGLRNITGLVGPNGLTAIWAITSTVSGAGDQGADPNRLYVVVDLLNNTNPTLAAKLPFFEIQSANFGEVLRGVAFTPGTDPHLLGNLF